MRQQAFCGSPSHSPARWHSVARSSGSGTATRCGRLLMAPGARPAIYVGKLVGVVTLLVATEIVVVPLVALLFQASLFDHILLMGALLLFGTIGFASVGTLFAAMLARARSRDVLLPILLYPVTIPVMIAGVRGTGALLEAAPQLDMARLWIMLLRFV